MTPHHCYPFPEMVKNVPGKGCWGTWKAGRNSQHAQRDPLGNSISTQYLLRHQANKPLKGLFSVRNNLFLMAQNDFWMILWMSSLSTCFNVGIKDLGLDTKVESYMETFRQQKMHGSPNLCSVLSAAREHKWSCAKLDLEWFRRKLKARQD